MLADLQNGFSGELYYNDTAAHRAVIMSYATDASVYQERPLAVAVPKTVDDIKRLVNYAAAAGVTLIPRAAGTSLAGQVVGKGIVVDISKYFTAITEVNTEEGWVKVQPGVIRDDLNAHLKPLGWMFGPETSTASRAMIGGMIGNNSCGLHSIVWGDTRENLLDVKVLLADGTEAIFGEIDRATFKQKCAEQTLEGSIYRSLADLLNQPQNRDAIENGFPKKSVHRRNTGYALDVLLDQFSANENATINLSKLMAGSEGTLCFVTEARLRLRKLPPKEKCIVAVHTATIDEALRSNIVALQHGCAASELVDDIILEYTKTNIDQRKNRFFVEGEPKTILMVEFFDEGVDALTAKAIAFIEEIKAKGWGYAYPILYGAETNNAWDLRKAGLGLLRNEPGDTQPVNLIEDCAVDAADLPDYISEVEALLKKYSVKYSMYAHAGAGELHVEPMINLKTSAGKHLFRTILQETAAIVKKYRGSLSGEHGDGRLRGEFIAFMMGEKAYDLFRQVKQIFDPKAVFNRGKIVDTPPMNEALRYTQDLPKKELQTVFDFSRQEGLLRLAEKCSGSGDCRKTHVTGGTMCPSFMATRHERDTTRARANMLRHFYTSRSYEVASTVNEEEVRNVLDLCLSCKACKSECPSSVDVGKMKAEFTQEYYDKHKPSLRAKMIGNFNAQMKLAAVFPPAYNLIFSTPALRRAANKAVGFHPDRTMPLLHKTTLRAWFEKHSQKHSAGSNGSVYLFCDEFSNFNDVEVGQKMILLLQRLGYRVLLPKHEESGRAFLSKGFVRKAKELAIKNVAALKDLVTEETPIIGIEPSAILSLRDEYPELVPADMQPAARQLAANTFLFEEWFAREMAKGHVTPEQFRTESREVFVHGHCHQKSLSSVNYIVQSLSVVPGYNVREIPSGCCGMAGSFGYEEEHYDVSMKIGGLVLFPAIQQMKADAIIAASGTSCRHQIKDGTGRKGKHTAEILYEALAGR
ncbi:MAG TPA: FAD-linked oxidase C-terminal domain-containing protein [Flavisolibacter sp.]|jgi:FAD/FMN-containing dehydrogenase/Fe-S oxidoreductase|nr:FAD-linked oxidase C-terminal domain-containing protein [Flavisolibacter sp.]